MTERWSPVTMPKTAQFAKTLGRSPLEWTDDEIERALEALREDLPGDPIGFIMAAVPLSRRCDCGSLHLSVDAPELEEATRGSLHRLIATPFGDIVREHVRRQSGVANVRFGWSGVDAYAPTFVRVVDIYDARKVRASELDDRTLGNIISAIRKDMPEMMEMLDASLRTLSVKAVSSPPGESGKREWRALIEQVMFAFSTPVRKYLDEYAKRNFGGARVGAVNCCIIMSDIGDGSAWQHRWFDTQVDQQLTPDC